MKRVSIFLIMVALIAGMVGCSVNEPPTINSMAADADWVLPFGSLNVTCDASDPENDELSYEWTTSGGNITGTGPEVVWTAPSGVGTYNITAVVSDSYGGSATHSLNVDVVCSSVHAANIELHQIQTAIVACMAEAETAQLTTWGDWYGELDVITVVVGNVTYDAGDYIYGPFWATYTVQQDGSITNGYCDYPGGWGDSIIWDPVNNNWVCTSVDVEYLRLLCPAAGSSIVPITDIDFIWTEITVADAYDWGLFSDPDLSSPIAVKSGLTATACTYTGTALAYDTTYYWQVTAYKEGRVINVSTIGTFTTISAPS
jgi:hypothetical protein